MRLDDFDFVLPTADRPAAGRPRDAARLLVVGASLADRRRPRPAAAAAAGRRARRQRYPGAADAAVRPARRGRRRGDADPAGGRRRLAGVGRPGGGCGRATRSTSPDFTARVAGSAKAVPLCSTSADPGGAGAALERHGAMPLPPYIRRAGADAAGSRGLPDGLRRAPGAVAAPTAGLHFTAGAAGGAARTPASRRVAVTLHVGAGTFLPVQGGAARGSCDARRVGRDRRGGGRRDRRRRARAGGRIVAVGTTALRLLETAADAGGRGRARRRARPRCSSPPATASASSTC